MAMEKSNLCFLMYGNAEIGLQTFLLIISDPKCLESGKHRDLTKMCTHQGQYRRGKEYATSFGEKRFCLVAITFTSPKASVTPSINRCLEKKKDRVLGVPQ